MCGLFGWKFKPGTVADNPASIRALALSLAASNDNRGGDSWGAYASESGETVKGVGRMAAMGYNAYGTVCNADTVIGHTRKATTGSVIADNSHPFNIGSVTGAHNGIVYNHRELTESHRRTYQVDSQHIFGHIAESLPLAEIEAYGAIAFHRDEHRGTLFVGTFNGGELSMADVAGVGTVFSSSRMHLSTALELAGWSDIASYYELVEGSLYRVNFGKECVHWCTKLDIASPRWGVSLSDRAATGSTATAAATTTGGLFANSGKSKRGRKPRKAKARWTSYQEERDELEILRMFHCDDEIQEMSEFEYRCALADAVQQLGYEDMEEYEETNLHSLDARDMRY